VKPKGTLFYRLGLVAILVSFILAGQFLLTAFWDRDGLRSSQGEGCVLLAWLVMFVALNLLATGLYRLAGHLYRSISRTDPEGDRPLVGPKVFLLGQIGLTTTVPITLPCLIDSTHRIPWDFALFAMFGLALTALFAISFFAGLGMMLRDTFVRQREIAKKRDAERRRRLDESDDARTELMHTALPAELRTHIKKDR
jgi:hypothetical protein